MGRRRLFNPNDCQVDTLMILQPVPELININTSNPFIGIPISGDWKVGKEWTHKSDTTLYLWFFSLQLTWPLLLFSEDPLNAWKLPNFTTPVTPVTPVTGSTTWAYRRIACTFLTGCLWLRRNHFGKVGMEFASCTDAVDREPYISLPWFSPDLAALHRSDPFF